MHNLKTIRTNTCLMPLVLVVSDLLALGCGGTFSVWLRYVFEGQFSLAFYWNLWPMMFLFIAAYGLAGLYPGILISPPEEIKKTSQTTSFCFVLLAVVVFLFKGSELYSRGIFFLAWFLVLLLVPLFRGGARRICARRPWWGYPAVIFGAGKTGAMVANTFLLRPRLGVRPVAVLDDDPRLHGQSVHGILVRGGVETVREFGCRWSNSLAILAMPGVDSARVGSIIEKHCRDFSRIIVIPDLFNISTLWINAIDFGGILGLDVAQRLLDARRQAFKRIFEVMIVLVTSPVTVPLLVFLALAIKIDNCGPVFFRQERIGRGGVPFRIWKFRTMIPEAETVIMDYLEKNPHLRQEWEVTHKLRQDPRITRIGKMLRKTSLDELPQLINVMCGDLSLVGPRPIVAEEAEKYKEVFDLYKKVRPGVTGLWQISGRSNTAYDERVDLDSYYVRNWSIWFDIYILAMTPKVVFTGHGAC